jgi:hypothetical protein
MTSLLLSLLALSLLELEPLDNFAENPSFEEDANRDALPDGWRPMAFESPARLAWDASVARTGRRSLRIRDSINETTTTTTDWKTCTGRWVTRARAVRPGTEYRLEVWVRTEQVSGSANAHLAWQRGSSWLSEIRTPSVSGTSDWQQLVVAGIAPEEADSVVVSLNLSRSKGAAWFDDVRVSGISEKLPEITYVFNDTDEWFPFTFPPDDTNLDQIDLTDLLDAPAGKHGFVEARPDGHFYFADGTRARFFGTNVGGRACAPDKEDARIIAARLAKYGCNMLRLHSMDGRHNPLIDYRDGTSQSFNAEALDRIDYFIAQLKQHGIYVYMDLLDYRWFRTADGVAQGDQFTHNWAGSMKGASIFDPRMIELQKDYATRLLTHRNPYTGLRYVDDPAVAVIEITNENSVFYFLRQPELSRPYYRDALTDRWNKWLTSSYATRVQLAKAWTDSQGRRALRQGEDPVSGTVTFPFGALRQLRGSAAERQFDPRYAPSRVRDALVMLGEIQSHYYTTMRAHLKELGVQVPIAGTNQMFVGVDTHIEATHNDFISRNQYWRHPHRSAKPFWKFSNEPMLRVDIPTQRTPLAVIARSSVAGKPQAVAEYNFPWPNEYRAEGLIMSVAYACLQDWDIFLLFSFEPGDVRLSMFRSQSDPVRWGEVPAAATMFLRHDVAAARNEVHIVQTPADRLLPRPTTSEARYTCQRFLTFTSKVRSAFIDDVYRGDADVALCCGPSAGALVEGTARVIRSEKRPWDQWLFPDFVAAARRLELPGYDKITADQKRFDSDTGQLQLDYGRGLFTINTPRTKSAIGFLEECGPVSIDGLEIECETPFAAVTATSLDGQPIGQSRRVLLTCVARAENTAQGFWPPTPEQRKWSTVNWMLPGEGRLPVITEPVEARVAIAMPGPVTAYALDPTGRRVKSLRFASHNNRVALNPATAKSIWCELVVE